MQLSGQGFSIKIVFRGVRGSRPVPGRETEIFGGNTSCIELEAGNRRLILDAGTGICSVDPRFQTDRQKKEAEGDRVYDLFLSHTHWDHIQGFPFFQPAYLRGNIINIYGYKGIEEILKKQMGEPCFPLEMQEMGAELNFYELEGKDRIKLNNPGGDRALEARLDNLLIKTYPGKHSRQSLCYRIEYRGKACTYLGDYEHYTGPSIDDNNTGLSIDDNAGYNSSDFENNPDNRLNDGLTGFIKGTDLLIYDAHFTDQEYQGLNGSASRRGWGHSTWQEGVKLAGKAGVKQLILSHHAPTRTDGELFEIEARAGELFPDALAAKEGMEIIL